MSSFDANGPGALVNYPTRVDRTHPRARLLGAVRALLVTTLTIIALIPVFVMGITAFKTHSDILASPPIVVFKPTLEGFVFLFTDWSVSP